MKFVRAIGFAVEDDAMDRSGGNALRRRAQRECVCNNASKNVFEKKKEREKEGKTRIARIVRGVPDAGNFIVSFFIPRDTYTQMILAAFPYMRERGPSLASRLPSLPFETLRETTR